ncbi:hypothetical protein SAMN02745866_04195 [Alteromonadaceae bacterium Bs31]|nr:hypothetical protein SAMN02745866_04195 [Alteromonadaceae bacterium Bs31]
MMVRLPSHATSACLLQCLLKLTNPGWEYGLAARHNCRQLNTAMDYCQLFTMNSILNYAECLNENQVRTISTC